VINIWYRQKSPTEEEDKKIGRSILLPFFFLSPSSLRFYSEKIERRMRKYYY